MVDEDLSSTNSEESSDENTLDDQTENRTRRRIRHNSYKQSGRRSSSADMGMFPILTSNKKKTVYTNGRPPWYSLQTGLKTEKEGCYVIGITGGSASGKTSVAKKIIEGIDIPWVVLLSMDSFYKGISTEEDKVAAAKGDYNFDHPNAFDWDMMTEVLSKIRDGKPVDVPHYCFVQHKRIPGMSTRVYGAGVVIFEGIMTLHHKKVVDLLHLKLFVDTDADIRLARRLKRDISERGRGLEDVFHQYDKHVKPGYQKYIGPSIDNADIVIPRGRDNLVAINLIIQHIKKQLDIRHIKSNREDIMAECIQGHTPDNLHILPCTNQVRGCQTIVRNAQTSRDDFIFYSERLMRMTFEYALSFLPHCDSEVIMPSGQSYQGKKFAGCGLCGVSILRAGETMEKALMKVTKEIRLGKFLIQTNEDGEPELHYIRLPRDIANDYVVLMDPIVGTGNAAMMAIRVLLDHDVKEDKIILVSLLMAECGSQAISYCFPDVKIATAMIDEVYDYDTRKILPGLGNFGDRYFGTC